MSYQHIPLSEVANRFKLQTRARHIEQLRTFPLSEIPLTARPVAALQRTQTLNDYKQWLLNCSKESSAQIQQAIAQKVLGGDEVTWPLALYAFMESAAVYLRDYDTFLEAVRAVQADDDDLALQLLDKSEAAIEEVAQAWGMGFVVACDLVEKSPQGHPFWDGPFCGLFFPRQPTDKNACVGIAFKGTDPSRLGEILVDANYGTQVAPDGTLWGTKVSHGVFDALFTYYPDPKIKPYEHILSSLADTHLLNPTVMIHTTGHSLGASYASFCHMETVRRLGNTPFDQHFFIGDLYTFGSPRVGLNDWASAAHTAVSAQAQGNAWRVVNAGDLVTKVPPVIPFLDENFIHLDVGWQISPTDVPFQLPTEIGTQTSPPFGGSVTPHQTDQYYAALRNALGEPTNLPPPEQDVIPAEVVIPLDG